MRVVQINSVVGQGSTGKLISSISDRMNEKGIENYICYGIGSSSRENAFKFENDLYLKCNILKTRLLGRHGFYSQYATRRLIKKLEELKPDVVHIHQIHGHYLNIRILADYINARKIPVVITMHDCWMYTGHCTHYTAEKCSKWKSGCGGCTQRRAYPDSYFFDRSKKNWLDKREIFLSFENVVYVCVSGWLENEARQSFLRTKPLTTIYNGLDCGIFQPGEKQQNKKFTILCMYGKWTDRINNSYREYLLKKIQQCDDIQLLLVGAPAEVENGNIRYTKYMSNAVELAEAYSGADVFLNLSHEDSFSLVSAESLACGTPVIGFYSTAIPEVIGSDGSCGYLVCEGQCDELWSCIESVKANGKQAYTQACRERAVRLFDVHHMTENYINLYYKICKEQ